jgi:chemotaxis signal transduction protein
MTVSGFRSTAAFALRARSKASAVERATFVTFSVGDHRFAAAVEAVERVLRWTAHAPAAVGADAGARTTVCYAGRDVPVVDFAERLGLVGRSSDASRVLVLNVANGWLAAVVDAVHDITTVDAASISVVAVAPVPGADAESRGAAAFATDFATAFAGARGTFVRDGREILVLDVARALGFRFT